MSSGHAGPDPDGDTGRNTPGLVFWVWVLVFAVFIGLTVYITVAG